MQAIAERLETAAVEPKGPGDVVFAELMLLYGARFGQQWAGLTPREIKASWNQRLADFSAAEIRRGLEACLGLDWPPTLPEFMRLCRPPVQADAAFQEAVHGLHARRNGQHGEWSHPAIYHAACKVGSYDMLNNTYSALKGRWEKALADCLLDRDLGPVPPPAAALPAPEPMSKEEAKRVMHEIGAADVLRPKKDMKAWARKIIASPEGKSPAVLKMAQAALQESA